MYPYDDVTRELSKTNSSLLERCRKLESLLKRIKEFMVLLAEDDKKMQLALDEFFKDEDTKDDTIVLDDEEV